MYYVINRHSLALKRQHLASRRNYLYSNAKRIEQPACPASGGDHHESGSILSRAVVNAGCLASLHNYAARLCAFYHFDPGAPDSNVEPSHQQAVLDLMIAGNENGSRSQFGDSGL
jgi:hypothetical protein